MMVFPTTLPIQITQDDIEQGIAEHCQNCPGALAIKRTIEGLTGFDARVNVLHFMVKIIVYEATRINGRTVFRTVASAEGGLPELLDEFVVRFDDGEWVGPISFDLDLEWREI